MSNIKISEAEAKALLNMIKKSLVSRIDYPCSGEQKEFDVVGDTKKDLFCINIFRGKINRKKCNTGARIKKNGVMLLELHINPGGEKIIGSHWHIYNEEYGRGVAFPAIDVDDDKFIDNAIDFLNKFNVVEKPKIQAQLELL